MATASGAVPARPETGSRTVDLRAPPATPLLDARLFEAAESRAFVVPEESTGRELSGNGAGCFQIGDAQCFMPFGIREGWATALRELASERDEQSDIVDGGHCLMLVK